MASTTLSLNRGVDTQAYGTTSFYTSTNGRILSITIRVSSTLPITDIQNVSSISLTITAGSNSYTTETKILGNGAVDYDLTFTVGLDFEEYTNISIYANCSNTITCYANTTYAHTGLTLISSGAHNSLIHINYEQHWTYTMTDGYLAEDGNQSENFVYFTTDDFGIPYNAGAWKLDDRNEGYPWLVTTEQVQPRGLFVFVLFNYLFKDTNSHNRMSENQDLNAWQQYTADMNEDDSPLKWVTSSNTPNYIHWYMLIMVLAIFLLVYTLI